MRRALVASVLAVLALAACADGDGREMDPPDDPLPPSTTTTTLAPADGFGIETDP